MSFAVIETGGKQYEVFEGGIIHIEKINDSSAEGDVIDFSNVLLLDDGSSTKIGKQCDEKKVSGTIEKIGKDKKVSIIKFKSKSNYRRQYGHRQSFWKVKIGSIPA